MRAKLVTGSATVAVLAATGLALAQTEPPKTDVPSSDVLFERLHSGELLEQFVAQRITPLRAADSDGDGLDREDVEFAARRRQAEMRANQISQALRHDLDGDFQVTRSELERTATGDEQYRGRSVDNMLERFDSNGDDVISLKEAAEAADGRPDDQLEALLELDPSGDGVLTADELRKLAEQAFASVDRDGDGRVSPGEFSAVADRVRRVQLARSAPVCDLPSLPDNAQLLVYGGYEGDAISTASIGGLDQETNLIEVAIEPGSTPLYLVLTSYESMLWQLSGATDRIAHVVVSSSASAREWRGDNKPKREGDAVPPPIVAGTGWAVRRQVSAAGVSGVPARKVTIANSGCPPYFSSVEANKAVPAVATLRRSLGREPDVIIGSYSVQRVSLPSGRLTRASSESAKPPRGFDPEMWTEAVRYWPGGLVSVDPRRVVARARVEPYEVLPSQMGLAQLIGSGAIQRAPERKLRIVRPIAHMPPSMGGAHSVTLVVAKGVPMPPGDPVHSCIISEEDGTSHGAACPRRE